MPNRISRELRLAQSPGASFATTIATSPSTVANRPGPRPPSQAEAPTTTTSISRIGGVSPISGVNHQGERPASTTPAAAIR